MVVEVTHPTLGHIQTLGSAIKLSATPTRVDRTAPLLGEHTDEILAEAGFSAKDIEQFYDAGAVHGTGASAHPVLVSG
jgi:crotonobetainyl-CoA:carnitine CoA-transferase CaiB-like acyl-CoA transferase